MARGQLFIEDGSQFGVSITRTRFRRMRMAEKREFMVQWFFQNFEDPGESTPHDAEDGFIYVWGGPYDAHEELSTTFGGMASERLIKEVAREIEKRGFEWAPIHSGDEQAVAPNDDSGPPHLDIYSEEPSTEYGSRAELEQRQRVLSALGRLESAIVQRPIGIGHNQPPESLDTPEIIEFRRSIGQLKAEFKRPFPSIATIKQRVIPLRNMVLRIGLWGVGVAFGGYFQTRFGPQIYQAFDAVIQWLEIAARSTI
jgi:hypothetical protein